MNKMGKLNRLLNFDSPKRGVGLFSIIIFLIFCQVNLVYATQCSDFLKAKADVQMNFDRISVALQKNHGVVLNKNYSEGLGVWNIHSREVGVNPDTYIPKEVVFAHEVTHMATDVKIERDPSPQTLARGISFSIAEGEGSFNDLVGQKLLKGDYQRYFRFDEAHAHWKSIIISEALAKQKKKNGDPDWPDFLTINRISRERALAFLEASKLLLEKIIQHLESPENDIQVDSFESRRNIKPSEDVINYLKAFNELIKKRASVDEIMSLGPIPEESNNLYDVSIVIETDGDLPDIRLELPIRWVGHAQDIHKDAVSVILDILHEGLTESHRLENYIKSKKLLEVKHLISNSDE